MSSTLPPSSARLPEILIPATSEGISRAAHLLAAGKIVILPTETVYGIALSLRHSETRKRVKTLKNLADRPGWVIHTGSTDAIFSWTKTIASVPRRLIVRSVPGPVAFQVKLSAADLDAARARLSDGSSEDAADETLIDGTLSLRCPDQPHALEILSHPSLRDHPIAILGAGLPGAPPVCEFEDIPEATLTQVDGALDAGPTRYRKPSSLVHIDGPNFSVTRPGVIDARIIDRLADFVILFVCTGNTCRSPMAAGIASTLIARRLAVEPSKLADRHVVVQSAGVHAYRGNRATHEAVDVVRSLGVNLSHHLSQPITPELLRRADVIYTMTSAHRDEVLQLSPEAQNKTFCLDPDSDIEDPIGAGAGTYLKVADRLSALIERRLDEWSL